MASLRVLQWNCYSVRLAFADLRALVSSLSPDIIFLQETWLSPNVAFAFPDFHCFRLDRPSGRGGGLLTLLSTRFAHSSSVVHEHMSALSELLVVRVRMPGCSPFDVCNVYCPKGFQSSAFLDTFLRLSSSGFCLAGDFNSHHVSWGPKTDGCGLRLWSWACQLGLSVLNDGSVTFVRGVSRSALDLTLISPRGPLCRVGND